MNSTIRTILIFVALIVAVLGASLFYRRAADPTPQGAVAQPTQIDETTLHPEMRKGLEALREERAEDAIAHFQAVPDDSSDYGAALLRAAVELAKRGDIEQAQVSIYELSQRHPDNPETLAVLGWLFYLGEDYDRAELAALRTLEINPGHVAARYNLALYRTAQGRSQASVRSYLRALREDPDGAEIALHRERLSVYHDDHPYEPAAHYALAFIANSTQDRETEVEELEHYLELVPEGTEADGARQRLQEAREALGG